jgi:hypothetical protein
MKPEAKKADPTDLIFLAVYHLSYWNRRKSAEEETHDGDPARGVDVVTVSAIGATASGLRAMICPFDDRSVPSGRSTSRHRTICSALTVHT